MDTYNPANAWSDDPDLQRIAEYVLWMRRRQRIKVKSFGYQPLQHLGSIGEGRGESEDLLYGPLLRTPIGLGDWEQLKRDRRLVKGILVQIAWDIRERELSLHRKCRVPSWSSEIVEALLHSRNLSVPV
jgi:hypothetical protein